jgi:anti-sigma B factor antagonist
MKGPGETPGLFRLGVDRSGLSKPAPQPRLRLPNWRVPAATEPAQAKEFTMQIEERIVDNVTILDLKGKVTLGEGDEALKDKINSLVQQGRTKILLNLGEVPYIDSAGLGQIVRTYTTVTRDGGQLKLVHLTKRIEDLLAITKLLTVFETFDSESEALKSYN